MDIFGAYPPHFWWLKYIKTRHLKAKTSLRNVRYAPTIHSQVGCPKHLLAISLISSVNIRFSLGFAGGTSHSPLAILPCYTPLYSSIPVFLIFSNHSLFTSHSLATPNSWQGRRVSWVVISLYPWHTGDTMTHQQQLGRLTQPGDTMLSCASSASCSFAFAFWCACSVLVRSAWQQRGRYAGPHLLDLPFS